MSTPSNPPHAKTVHKAGAGGQVPPTGRTMKPHEQVTTPPKGIKAPRVKSKSLSAPKSPRSLSYKGRS